MSMSQTACSSCCDTSPFRPALPTMGTSRGQTSNPPPALGPFVGIPEVVPRSHIPGLELHCLLELNH
jgi:hypothetical protein